MTDLINEEDLSSAAEQQKTRLGLRVERSRVRIGTAPVISHTNTRALTSLYGNGAECDALLFIVALIVVYCLPSGTNRVYANRQHILMVLWYIRRGLSSE